MIVPYYCFQHGPYTVETNPNSAYTAPECPACMHARIAPCAAQPVVNVQVKLDRELPSGITGPFYEVRCSTCPWVRRSEDIEWARGAYHEHLVEKHGLKPTDGAQRWWNGG